MNEHLPVFENEIEGYGVVEGRGAFLMQTGRAGTVSWAPTRSLPMLRPGWTREDGIAWLQRADLNGIWTDEDCVGNDLPPMTHLRTAEWIVYLSGEAGECSPIPRR